MEGLEGNIDLYLQKYTNLENIRNDVLINEMFTSTDSVFVRKFVPFENDLHPSMYNIQFQVDNIDRVYIKDHNHELININDDEHILVCLIELYCRVKIQNIYLFLGILFKKGQKCQLHKDTREVLNINVMCRYGTIFICQNVNYFLKSVLKYTPDLEGIYRSLKLDNYDIIGDYAYNLFFNCHMKSIRVDISAPSLKQRCMYYIFKKLKYIFSENGGVILSKTELPEGLKNELTFFYKFCYTKEYFYDGVDEYFISYA